MLKKILKISLFFFAAVIVSFFGGSLWWRLWMHKGWPGTGPIFWWLNKYFHADGENAYDLEFAIMSAIIFLILLTAMFLYKWIRKRQKNKSKMHLNETDLKSYHNELNR